MDSIFLYLPFLQIDPVTAALLIQASSAAIGVGQTIASQQEARRTRRSSKEAERQADIARQAQEVVQIGQEFLSQLVPGSPEFSEMLAAIIDARRRSDQRGIAETGARLFTQQFERLQRGEAITGGEARTDLSFETLRKIAEFTPEEKDIFNAIRGAATETPTGEIATGLVERARTPDEFFQSTLDEQLEQARDIVGTRFARRGLVGSGLELEGLGRAGVDLALQEAQAREEFRQQQLANFGQLFNVSQGLRGREIGIEEFRTKMQRDREREILDLLFRQSQRSLADRTAFEGGRVGFRQDVAVDASREAEQRRQEAIEAAFDFGGDIAGSFTTPQVAFAGTQTQRPSDLQRIDRLLEKARLGTVSDEEQRSVSSLLSRVPR